MEAEVASEIQSELVHSAIIFKQGSLFLHQIHIAIRADAALWYIGIHFVVSCAANTYESTDLIVQPIVLLHEQGDHPNRPSIQSAHNAGPLPGLSDHVYGIVSCDDDLLAFDDEGVLVRTSLIKLFADLSPEK